MVWKPSLLQKGPRDSSWLLLHSWEQRKLREIVERVVRKNTNNESTLPLTISAQYGLVDQITYFNNRVASRDISNYYLVLNGEFAYNKSTSDGFPFGAVKRLDLYPKGVLSTLYIVFSLRDQEQISSDFLSVFFDTDRWHRGVAERAAEGARNHGLLNISTEDFFDIDLRIPKEKREQDKIGALFRGIDHLITLHQRVYFQRRKNKNCLRQKITFAWEQREFENFAQRKSEMGNSSSAPCVEYEDIIADQGRLNKDVFQKRSHKTGIKFSAGDVLFGKLRPYLKNWLLPDFSGVAVGDFWVLKPSGTDSRFLYYLIQTSEFFSVSNQSAGSKMPRADWNLVSQYAFHIPGEENEQQKIGSLFRRIDALITLHQREYLLFEVLLC